MAVVKSISIDIGVRNAEQAKAKLDEIDARAEALKAAFPEYKLKIDSAVATERLAVFRGQVKAVADDARKPIDMTVLTDKAKAKLAGIEAEAEALRARFPHFTVRIDDAEAKRKLALFAAEARVTTDEIDRRLSGAGSGRGGVLGGLAGLLGGGGGPGGAAAAAGPGVGPTAYLWGGLGTLAALLAPGLVPLAVGLGVGGLGVGGALFAGNYLKQQVTTAQQAVTTARNAQLSQAGLANTILGQQQQIATASRPGATAAQRAALPGLQRALALNQARYAAGAPAAAALPHAQAQLAQEQQLLAPFTGLTASFTKLGDTALMTFAKSVAPILKPVSGIFDSLGRQVQQLQPLMTAMFSASLPFIKMFADLFTQIAKILMPAFTQSMSDLVKSGALPIMEQGLTTLVKGIAGFITALGPGMKSSAMIFNDVAVIIAGILRGLGLAVAWLANAFEDWAHRMRMRAHEAAAQWDDFRHVTAATFDGIRHDIAHYWDLIWNNTIGRVQRGTGDVVSWFKGLPARILDALKTLGTDLLNLGRQALGQLWQGLKDAAGSVTKGGILGWIAGFAHGIVDTFKKIWGWFSPSSVMYQGGKSLMQGLAAGIKDHAHLAQRQAVSVGSFVATGIAGAGVQRWAGTVLKALAMEHLPASLLQDVLYQMQTESGGNQFAQNNWDINAQLGTPSKGLMQVIQPTFDYWHWPGTSWNIFDPLANIAAALNYAAHGKGFGSGIGQIGSGHGYALGTMSAAPGWAWVGEAGPEMVRFRGGEQVRPAGGGVVIENLNLNVNVPRGVNGRQVGQEIAEYLAQFIKGGGRIYPAGVVPR